MDTPWTPVKPMNSCKEIATGLSVNGPRTCQALGVMLSRHHHISSVPKQVPWTVVLLLLSPGSPRFRLSEATFLSQLIAFMPSMSFRFLKMFLSLSPSSGHFSNYVLTFGPLMVICCQELLFLPSSLLPLFLKNNVCINWVKKKNLILLKGLSPKLGFPDDFRQGMQTVVCFPFLIKWNRQCLCFIPGELKSTAFWDDYVRVPFNCWDFGCGF